MYIPWWFLTHTTSHPKMHFWVWWFSRIFTRSWDMWSFFSGTPTHLDVVTPPQRKIDSGFDLTLHFIVKYAGSLKAKIQHSLPNKKSTDLQRAAIFQHLLGGFLQNLQGSNESPMHTSNIYIYIYIDMGFQRMLFQKQECSMFLVHVNKINKVIWLF